MYSCAQTIQSLLSRQDHPTAEPLLHHKAYVLERTQGYWQHSCAEGRAMPSWWAGGAALLSQLRHSWHTTRLHLVPRPHQPRAPDAQQSHVPRQAASCQAGTNLKAIQTRFPSGAEISHVEADISNLICPLTDSRHCQLSLNTPSIKCLVSNQRKLPDHSSFLGG